MLNDFRYEIYCVLPCFFYLCPSSYFFFFNVTLSTEFHRDMGLFAALKCLSSAPAIIFSFKRVIADSIIS